MKRYLSNPCMCSRPTSRLDTRGPSSLSASGQRFRRHRSEPGWHAPFGRAYGHRSRSADGDRSSGKRTGCQRMAIRSDGVYRPLDPLSLQLILCRHHRPSLSCPRHDSLLVIWTPFVVGAMINERKVPILSVPLWQSSPLCWMIGWSIRALTAAPISLTTSRTI